MVTLFALETVEESKVDGLLRGLIVLTKIICLIYLLFISLNIYALNSEAFIIKVGRNPQKPVLLNNMIYIANKFENSITIIDPQSHIVKETLNVVKSPLRPFLGGSMIYVMSEFDGEVQVLDPRDNHKLIANFFVGAYPREAVQINNLIYIASFSDSMIYVINSQTHSILQKIKSQGHVNQLLIYDNNLLTLESNPAYINIRDKEYLINNQYAVDNYAKPLHIAGKDIYLVSSVGNSCAVFDAHDFRLCARIKIANYLNRPIYYNNHVYISSEENSKLYVIDTRSYEIIKILDVEALPRSATVIKDKLYVANKGNSSVSIIDTQSHELNLTLRVGRRPRAPVLINNFLYIAHSGCDTILVIPMNKVQE
jgi:YVTN family beta-propeller protein